MQVQQVTRDAGSDPGGGAGARARADEEWRALPLHARRRVGDRAGTAAVSIKGTPIFAATSLGQGAPARSGAQPRPPRRRRRRPAADAARSEDSHVLSQAQRSPDPLASAALS
eukprot:scaffold70300_cov32-Phaeocystis_antarctica.AAC.2